MTGGGVSLDHFGGALYTGDATFPRTISSGSVDASSGFIFGTAPVVNTSWYPFLSTGASSGYSRRTFDDTNPNQDYLSTDFGITSAGPEFKTSAAPGANMNVSARSYVMYFIKGMPGLLSRVQYTGNGANRAIAHGLGSTPGMMWIFRALGNRRVWHRGMTDSTYTLQFGTQAEAVDTTVWNSTPPDATNFYLGTNSNVNGNTNGFTAYFWAHDTASNGVCQCFTYTGNGSASGPTVTLGWDPRLILIKRLSGATGDWVLLDQIRTPGFTGNEAISELNLTGQNGAAADYVSLTGTGFQIVNTAARINANGAAYVGMAIR